MGLPTKVFFCEPTNIERQKLEVVGPGGCGGDGAALCHCARVFMMDIERAEVRSRLREFDSFGRLPADVGVGKDDPRWPTRCDRCDYVFGPADRKNINCQIMRRRTDTGALIERYGMPVGAVWEEDIRENPPLGFDGRALIVMTPEGEWRPDRRASNCTRPTDTVHRCWVRHGRPEDGTMHVDKAGDTCTAGAGSIIIGSFHGFLHNGHLTNC